jgi:branched-chain amino acid aminotransferase
VFLVSTTRDVQAVRQVDDRLLGAPGPVTRDVAEAWAREESKTSDP